MIKKILLPAVLVGISQIGIINPVSATEKPEIKTEQPKVKKELTEADKKRLIDNRMVIQVAMKQNFGEDVANHESMDSRNIISRKEYKLAPKIIKFKCPTAEELKTAEIKDQNQSHFINKEGLKFLTTRPLNDVISKGGDLEEVSHTEGSNEVWCSYKNLRSSVYFEVHPRYNLTYDKEKFEISVEDGDGRELTSRKHNVEFILTNKK